MTFLFVDRILRLVPGEYVTGIKHITQDDFYLCRDEDQNWCFMPALIGETLGQLTAWNVMLNCDFSLRPVAGIVSSATLHRSAYVGETLFLESFIDRLDEESVLYHSKATINGELVFSIEGALGPLLPMSQFISAENVRQQFSSIYRPLPELSPPVYSAQERGEGTDRAEGEKIEELAMASSLPIFAPRGQEARDAPCSPIVSTVKNGVQNSYLMANQPVARCVYFEEILEQSEFSIVAKKRITKSAPYFPDHFPFKPVLPLTILLESIFNLTREFLITANWAMNYKISEVRKIKMNEFIYPGDTISSRLTVKEKNEKELILTARTEVEEKRVCVFDLILVSRI